MSKTGIRGFYLITEQIETQLLADPNVNTVTTGDITDIDLDKTSIYPLSHIIVNSANLEENLIRFSISSIREVPVFIFIGTFISLIPK